MKDAAEKLFLTQPAISKTLKELEGILDTTLMLRSRAGVTLTQQGELFLHFAQNSLASLELGMSRLEASETLGAERLNVGVLPSVAASLMPDVITEFSALAPHATLRISDGPHGFLTERLRLGELDIVIGRLGDPDMMQGLTFTQLYTENVEFVVRKGHPLSGSTDVQSITNYLVLYPPPAAAITALVKTFLAANNVGEIPNRVESVSGALGRVFIRRSDAVWIISGGVVANEIEEGLLERLPFDTSPTRGPVGLLTRSDATELPIQHVFLTTLRSVLAHRQKDSASVER